MTRAVPEDVDLLLAIAHRRDQASFELLFARYERPALSLAYHLTGHRERAEEAVQEAMLRVWQSAHTFRPEGNPRGWILRIVSRVSLRMNERQPRERSFPQGQLGPGVADAAEPSPTHRDFGVDLRQALERLPLLQRQLVALYYGAGLSQHEIARALSMPQRTVAHRLNLTLGTLRRRLTPSGSSTRIPQLEPLLWSAVFWDGDGPSGALAPRIQAGSGNGAPAVPSRGLALVAHKSLLALAGLVVTVSGGIWVGSSGPAPRGGETESRATAEATAGERLAGGGRANRPPLNRVWNFESAEEMKEISATSGSWRWVSGQGPDGSGCTSAGEGTLLEFNLPDLRLPVLVSCLARPLEPDADVMVAAGWSRNRAFCWIRTRYEVVRPRASIQQSWQRYETFVSEAFLVSRAMGGGTVVNFGLPAPGARLVLGLRGGYLLDRLQIREIDAGQVPDVRAVTRAFARIPPQARKGVVALPELMAGSPKRTVFAEFSPASPWPLDLNLDPQGRVASPGRAGPVP